MDTSANEMNDEWWLKKNSICWLGIFWSMAAGLIWFLAGHELVEVGHVLVLNWS